MAVTRDQLKQLANIKDTLAAKRDNEKGLNWKQIAKFVLQELADNEDKRKGLPSESAPNYTNLATNALQGWAYGRSVGWMHLKDEAKMKGKGKNKVKLSQEAEAWFRDCEDMLLDDIARSAFYDESLGFTKIALNLSTAIMLVDWVEARDMLYVETLNPRRCCIAEGPAHDIEVLFTDFEMDKSQAMQKFGKKCPKKIQDCREWTQEFTFTKAVFKAGTYDMKVNGKGEWCEVVWCNDDMDAPCSERRMGYKPFIVWRFERSMTGSPWGVNSPGERSLGTITALNVVEKSTMKGIQLFKDPMVKATEGLEVEIRPSNVIPLSGNQDFQFVAPQGSSNDNGTMAYIAKKEQELKEAYYVDFFLMLQQSMEQRKTATEVAELSDEKAQVLASFTSRINGEFLEPFLEAVFALEQEHGRLPEAPEELQGHEVKIDFVSPLAIAQKKAQKYAPTRQFIAEAMAFYEFDPSVKYLFNIPEYVNRMAEDLMIDPDFMRKQEEVEKMVEQDREMAMQQMQAQNEAQSAQTLNALSKAPEQGSIAQALTGVSGAAANGGR